MLFFILSALIQKKHSEWYEMGVKSFVLCYYVNHWCFAQGSNKVRGFFLSVSRCAISRRQAHVRRVTRWEGGILNYELVLGECFPLDIIREIPAWPLKTGNYGKQLLSTRIQNWTSNFLCTVCWIESWQPIYAQHILLVKHWGNLVGSLHKYFICNT